MFLYSDLLQIGPLKSNKNRRLMALSVITLNGFRCNFVDHLIQFKIIACFFEHGEKQRKTGNVLFTTIIILLLIRLSKQGREII